jgi:hypothetical protein
MKNTSWKTTLVGVFAMLVLLIALALVYFEKATFKEVGESLSYITAFLIGLAAFFSKDKDKTGLPNDSK